MAARLNIHHLRHFNDQLHREVIAPLRAAGDVGDKAALASIINFGNAFMEREKANLAYANSVIWFDVHLGEPAKIGMTWAHNPHQPVDPRFGIEGFWRMWSEVEWDGEDIISLEQAQQEFSGYTLQHIRAA